MSEITLPNGMKVPVPETKGPGRPALPPEQRFVGKPGNMIQKTRWNHELAIDLMLANPDWNQKDVALYFGYSESWVSMVVASDAFQAKLAERRDEIVNPEIRASVEERFRALANHSLAKLHEKLANPNASDNLVLRSAELAAKALGLGARPQAAPVQMNVAIVVPPKAPREPVPVNG